MCHSFVPGPDRPFDHEEETDGDEDDELPSFAEEEGADVEVLTDGGDES